MEKVELRMAVALTLLFSLPSIGAIPSKTNITVEAEISTSVQVYVDGRDVTSGTIMVKLNDKDGYMTSTTPPFQFIGNAKSVTLSLETPPGNLLTSGSNPSDTMRINTAWIRIDGRDVTTDYTLNNQTVYPTLADVPDLQKGIKVKFTSAQRSETYPLGSYSGTYVVTVRPNA